MNCHTCGYSLWNLRARQCPECGRAFRPGDYRFVARAVQFACPHCDQRYVGTDERGHPSPREFECTGCHRRIDVDEMILRPAEGVSEHETSPGGVAWIDRRNRGRVRAFLQTIVAALVRPRQMMQNLPLEAPAGDILTFGMLATTLALLAGLLPICWIVAWMSYSWHFDGAEIVYFLAVFVIGPTIAAAAVAPVLGILAHIGLRITGGCAYGADRTFQAFGAAAGASVVCAVPVIGWALGWIWWAGSTIAALAAAQRVHLLRAAVAVLLLPALIAGAIVSAGVVHYRQSLQQVNRWQDPVARMVIAMNSFQWQGGSAPVHAVELILFQRWQLDPNQTGRPFCHPDTKTMTSNIAVGEKTLQELLTFGREDRVRAAYDYIGTLPKNLIAHRFGDYVYTYHGATLSGYDPSLWILVMLPDPSVNGPPSSVTEIILGLGDSSVKTLKFSEFPAELKKQNTYRQSIRLPPLPDLLSITHDSPAVGPAETDTEEDE